MTAQPTAVEAMARAMCEIDIRTKRKWDTEAAKLEAMLPGAVNAHWPNYVADALVGLKALRDAVTPGMAEAGCDSVNPVGCCCMDEVDAGVAFRAMIDAAIEEAGDTGEGL